MKKLFICDITGVVIKEPSELSMMSLIRKLLDLDIVGAPPDCCFIGLMCASDRVTVNDIMVISWRL